MTSLSSNIISISSEDMLCLSNISRNTLRGIHLAECFKQGILQWRLFLCWTLKHLCKQDFSIVLLDLGPVPFTRVVHEPVRNIEYRSNIQLLTGILDFIGLMKGSIVHKQIYEIIVLCSFSYRI